MCAGKGIIHAEMPVHKDGAPDPRGLQLWIDLPKEVRHHLTYVTDGRVLICVSPLVQNGGMYPAPAHHLDMYLTLTCIGSFVPGTWPQRVSHNFVHPRRKPR